MFDVSGIAVRYRIQGVVWGTFRMRAFKHGFRVLETSVTVPLVEITRGPNAGRSTTSGGAGLGDGTYRFTRLLDGDAYVQASKPGFVSEYLNTAQICGDYRADFKLIPTNASLVGMVRDENGAPLAGARVEILSLGRQSD